MDSTGIDFIMGSVGSLFQAHPLAAFFGAFVAVLLWECGIGRSRLKANSTIDLAINIVRAILKAVRRGE